MMQTWSEYVKGLQFGGSQKFMSAIEAPSGRNPCNVQGRRRANCGFARCKKKDRLTAIYPKFNCRLLRRRAQQNSSFCASRATLVYSSRSCSIVVVVLSIRSIVPVILVPIAVPNTVAQVIGGVARSSLAPMLVLTAPFAMAPPIAVAVKATAVQRKGRRSR
jgi:hypothetical protein